MCIRFIVTITYPLFNFVTFIGLVLHFGHLGNYEISIIFVLIRKKRSTLISICMFGTYLVPSPTPFFFSSTLFHELGYLTGLTLPFGYIVENHINSLSLSLSKLLLQRVTINYLHIISLYFWKQNMFKKSPGKHHYSLFPQTCSHVSHLT